MKVQYAEVIRQVEGNKRANGFTLIELVAVIVILGILAATALPKFIDLTKDARVAKVQAMEGTLRSTAELWHAACVVNGGACLTYGSLTKSGITANLMYNGYPNAGDYLNNGQIDALINHSGFTVTLPNYATHRFVVEGAPGNCYVEYGEAPSASTPPPITTITTGC